MRDILAKVYKMLHIIVMDLDVPTTTATWTRTTKTGSICASI